MTNMLYETEMHAIGRLRIAGDANPRKNGALPQNLRLLNEFAWQYSTGNADDAGNALANHTQQAGLPPCSMRVMVEWALAKREAVGYAVFQKEK